MADMTLQGMERTDLIVESFGSLALAVPGVDEFMAYRPEEVPPGTTVCAYFDWRGTSARATTLITRKTWEWVIEIYVQGEERYEMQRRMTGVIIGIDESVDRNPTLDRAASKPVRLENMGPPIPYASGDSGVRGLLKRFRLVVEAEQAL